MKFVKENNFLKLKKILTVDAPIVSGLLESTTYNTALVLPGSTTGKFVNQYEPISQVRFKGLKKEKLT